MEQKVKQLVVYSTSISDAIRFSFENYKIKKEKYGVDSNEARAAFISFTGNCEKENKHYKSVFQILNK